MFREWIGCCVLLFACAAAIAEPPAGERVLAKANVPLASDAMIVSCKLAGGFVLPLPGLGFVPVPVELWKCDVWHTPPNAPAGAPKARASVRLLTLAE